MPADNQKLVDLIERMDRRALVEMLRHMRCDFRLDFSDEFLGSVSLERLRHIAMAASLHARGAAWPTP